MKRIRINQDLTNVDVCEKYAIVTYDQWRFLDAAICDTREELNETYNYVDEVLGIYVFECDRFYVGSLDDYRRVLKDYVLEAHVALHPDKFKHDDDGWVDAPTQPTLRKCE